MSSSFKPLLSFLHLLTHPPTHSPAPQKNSGCIMFCHMYFAICSAVASSMVLYLKEDPLRYVPPPSHPPTHPLPTYSTSFQPPRSPLSFHPPTHPPTHPPQQPLPRVQCGYLYLDPTHPGRGLPRLLRPPVPGPLPKQDPRPVVRPSSSSSSSSSSSISHPPTRKQNTQQQLIRTACLLLLLLLFLQSTQPPT